MNGLKVYAVQADPPDACEKLVPPPTNATTEKVNWVVLIAR